MDLDESAQIDTVVAEVLMFVSVERHADILGSPMRPLLALYWARMFREHPDWVGDPSERFSQVIVKSGIIDDVARGKRDWWTGNQFVQDVRNRVKLPVQIATDNHRPYAFHIRQHFGYEGYSYGTETKIFGEPKLTDGTLARLGRNEGVRKMETAERRAVVRLAGLRNPHHKPCRACIFDSATGIEAI